MHHAAGRPVPQIGRVRGNAGLKIVQRFTILRASAEARKPDI